MCVPMLPRFSDWAHFCALLSIHTRNPVSSCEHEGSEITGFLNCSANVSDRLGIGGSETTCDRVNLRPLPRMPFRTNGLNHPPIDMVRFLYLGKRAWRALGLTSRRQYDHPWSLGF
jgi:hypothetical protein